MENIGQKRSLVKKKKNLRPKMALENAFKKCGYHLQKSNFKVQDTTTSV